MQATPGEALTADPGNSRAPAPRRAVLLLIVAGLAWGADALTKSLAVERLAGRDPVEIVPHVLSLTLTRNAGAAFSLGTELTVLLTLVACVVAAVVLWLTPRVRSQGWALTLGLLLGGVLGNLTDRLLREPAPFRGHVVDFLQLPSWPVFNLADSWIVLAAFLVAYLSLRGTGLDGASAGSALHRRP